MVGIFTKPVLFSTAGWGEFNGGGGDLTLRTSGGNIRVELR